MVCCSSRVRLGQVPIAFWYMASIWFITNEAVAGYGSVSRHSDMSRGGLQAE